MTKLLETLRGLASPPQNCQSRHFYWLDLVRGFAALAILVWHYQHFYYQTAGRNPIVYDRDVQPFYGVLALLYNEGYFAVQLFWVISGFVFSSVYTATPTSGREFFVNRFARLYPLHLLTLVLVAGLQAISFGLQHEYQIYAINDVYHFVLNLFFVSHWGFEAGDSFNAPIWSVSVEIFVYLVFWVVLRYLFRFGILGPLAMVALFGALVVLQVPGPFWLCGLYFFLGAAVYVWLVHFKDHNRWNFSIGLAAMMASSTLLFLGIENMGYISRIILFSSMVLVAASIDLQDLKQRGKRFTALGDLTYSLYLLHVPVQITLILLLDQFGVDRVGLAGTPLFFLFFMTLMLVVSTLSYRYFELPMRKWVRHRFRRPARDSLWQGGQLTKD
jgi:peptidoglycan/LPS O-acetylase OafA/YrhL